MKGGLAPARLLLVILLRGDDSPIQNSLSKAKKPKSENILGLGVEASELPSIMAWVGAVGVAEYRDDELLCIHIIIIMFEVHVYPTKPNSPGGPGGGGL